MGNVTRKATENRRTKKKRTRKIRQNEFHSIYLLYLSIFYWKFLAHNERFWQCNAEYSPLELWKKWKTKKKQDEEWMEKPIEWKTLLFFFFFCLLSFVALCSIVVFVVNEVKKFQRLRLKILVNANRNDGKTKIEEENNFCWFFFYFYFVVWKLRACLLDVVLKMEFSCPSCIERAISNGKYLIRSVLVLPYSFTLMFVTTDEI